MSPTQIEADQTVIRVADLAAVDSFYSTETTIPVLVFVAGVLCVLTWPIIGVCLIALGIVSFVQAVRNRRYHIRMTAKSGEICLLTATNEAHANQVVEKVREAIDRNG